MRINQRIEISVNTDGLLETRKKRKQKSMPPRTKKEANQILDALHERNPILALTSEMSALTGLRYSDCSWLKYSDFYDEFDNFLPQLQICQQKVFRMRIGRKNPMSEAQAFRKSLVQVYTSSEIERIVEETRHYSCSSEFLFANPKSRKILDDGTVIERPMSVESADWHHAKVKQSLQLNFTLGTHSWRKLFASLLIQDGATIEKIRDLLGQASLTSTNAYLESFSTDLKVHATKLTLGMD